MTKWQKIMFLLLLIVAAVVVFLLLVPDWFYHPGGYCVGTPVQVMDCRGYNFWSGISGSDLEIPFALAVFAAGWWHQHNCHHKGCMWLQFHPHPEHGHPVCKKHYEEHEDGVIPGDSRPKVDSGILAASK